uniref:GAG-pre-integrase domain-containing protein n=1 Tax=Fagus sylvatica TaxID=28930 RepID=A0A2N9I6F2_FAGSY
MLPKGTKLYIDDALYSSKSRRNLLSFKDIRHNGYHIETNNKGSEEFLYITSMVSGQKLIIEKLPIFSSGLYYTTMRTIETNVIVHQKCSDPNIFMLWHNRLGHPGSIMMRRIIENSYGHPLKNQKILSPSDYPCSACSQGIANQLPDVFTDSKKIVKSHIPAANNPARIEVPEGQLINIAANESKTRLKRGRPVGAKDKIPRKRKIQEKQVAAPEEAIPMKQATDIINLSKDCAHKSPENEPPEEGTPEELSPEEEQVPENDEISIHYVSTGEIWDRNKIVVDNIFSFKVALDITRSNDHEIEPQTVEQCRRRNDWPKWKEAIQAELNSLLKREVFGPIVQTPKGVMPVGYKWVFVRKRNEKNEIIRYKARLVAQESGFAIIAVYVDDLNLVGTPEELTKTADYLKNEFEMKDLGKTKFCLGLQIEHLPDGILIHQSTYTEKVLKHFHMDNAHPLSTPMVVRSLDVKKDPFRPQEVGEETLGPKVPYLSAIGALMYLANCTQPDIAFSVNLLARYSSAPTLRHWNGVKHVLRYLRGTTDMGLFYPNKSNPQLIGYADAGYLSYPHKGRSQIGYLFTCGNTAISWRSVKQTISATSSNHSEIIAIHEASRECVWLRSVIQHIREKCGLSSIKDNPTILYEDNAACITQIRGGYIIGDRTKHISPKFFYTHELQKSGDIDVKQIRSSENLADIFTKSLPTTTFKKIVHSIGMRRLKDLLILDN